MTGDIIPSRGVELNFTNLVTTLGLTSGVLYEFSPERAGRLARDTNIPGNKTRALVNGCIAVTYNKMYSRKTTDWYVTPSQNRVRRGDEWLTGWANGGTIIRTVDMISGDTDWYYNTCTYMATGTMQVGSSFQLNDGADGDFINAWWVELEPYSACVESFGVVCNRDSGFAPCA